MASAKTAKNAKSVGQRVTAFRDRVLSEGGSTLYANIGKEATKALNTIMEKKEYSKAGAVEFALMKAAKELTRAR